MQKRLYSGCLQCRLCRSWQRNGEKGTTVFTIFPGQRPGVGFDNAARDRQSHAGSFGFGGEEGLE